MREILFRGKILGLTDWAYGYYAKSGENHFILLDTDNEDNYSIVDPETVGQFTGLCDKNGNKIFEGDIVSSNKRKTWIGMGEVWFGNGAFWCGEREWAKLLRVVCLEDEQAEVIGTIHDNPELLEDNRMWGNGKENK